MLLLLVFPIIFLVFYVAFLLIINLSLFLFFYTFHHSQRLACTLKNDKQVDSDSILSSNHFQVCCHCLPPVHSRPTCNIAYIQLYDPNGCLCSHQLISTLKKSVICAINLCYSHTKLQWFFCHYCLFSG